MLKGLTRRFLDRSSQSEKRVSVIGTIGSGKTTALGLICLTCETLTNVDPTFKFDIREKTSGVRQAPSDLRQGHFPPKTLPGTYYEADLIMKWEGSFGDKIVRLPFCETAGEEVQRWINRFSRGMYDLQRDFRSAGEIYKYVSSSNGFILVCPVSRALMFTPDKQLEQEPSDLPRDPDLNLVRILEAIYDYKERTHSPPIEGMAVLLTKYDVIQPFAQAMGVDLYQPGGPERFMKAYFPATTAKLNFYGIDKVQFFPSYVQVERMPDNSLAKWPDGTDKIVLNPHRPRMPVYSEQDYINLINWIQRTWAS